MQASTLSLVDIKDFECLVCMSIPKPTFIFQHSPCKAVVCGSCINGLSQNMSQAVRCPKCSGNIPLDEMTCDN